jgi:hypothetical protein
MDFLFIPLWRKKLVLEGKYQISVFGKKPIPVFGKKTDTGFGDTYW